MTGLELLALLSLSLPLAQAEERPEEPTKVAVLGSSVAAGWVTSRESKHDLGNGWAARLERLLAPRGVVVVNASIPGDDTEAVLARMERDLAATDPDVVLIALSLGNEGLAEEREQAVTNFRAGLPRIVTLCLDAGRQPVIGLCYANDDYDAGDYAAVQETNLWIQSLGHPCIDFLGALDDGEGHFARGFTYDGGHPDNRGHEAMFRAVVPSLFDALRAGKPPPERPGGAESTAVGPDDGPAPLSHVPADVVESFALSFRVDASAAGAVAAVRGADGLAVLALDGQGHLVYSPPLGAAIESTTRVADGATHDITLSHRHLLGRTELFLDGELVGAVDQQVVPRQFVLGGPGDAEGAAPASARYRDWWIHRTALNLGDVQALLAGAVLTASLEVYSPLDAVELLPDAEVENRAQSTARVLSRPTNVSQAIASLESEIARAHAERAEELVVPARVVVELEPELLEEYAGTYEIAPGDRLVVRRDASRLVLVDRGQEMELHALDENTFFIRTLGEPTLTFERDDVRRVHRLVLALGEAEVPAPRVDERG